MTAQRANLTQRFGSVSPADTSWHHRGACRPGAAPKEASWDLTEEQTEQLGGTPPHRHHELLTDAQRYAISVGICEACGTGFPRPIGSGQVRRHCSPACRPRKAAAPKVPKTCLVDNCDRAVYAREVCTIHHRLMYRPRTASKERTAA